ncbi:hypothetical protein QBC35DRAFT_487956 [Podospora australis]|uniref:Uncharacterized protein n=1 Tax=Podospora australis TaxID=1536484 RepID=A0AAN7AJT9_9PEZI|nr:hypothetical protein QBC35DRAFT_487956 [Podospora australis]
MIRVLLSAFLFSLSWPLSILEIPKLDSSLQTHSFCTEDICPKASASGQSLFQSSHNNPKTPDSKSLLDLGDPFATLPAPPPFSILLLAWIPSVPVCS